MKITLIKTGGTISTTSENGIMIAGKSNAAEEFLKPSAVCSPFTKLSENFTVRDIARLKDEIKAQKNTDAIIVTIGTDSLTYSSALLSFMLSDIKIPVVLVSSAYPPSDVRSNARANLSAAKAFIKEGIPGVFVAYRNDGESAKIHFGARLNASRLFDGYVSSAQNRIAARVVNGKVSIIERVERTPMVGVDRDQDYTAKIKIVSAYPSVRYDELTDCDAVIAEGYHSGTVPTEGDISVNNCPVRGFITGGIKGDKYESVQNVLKLKFVDNITTAALYAKLTLLLPSNMSVKEQEKAIFTNYVGEFFL